MNILDGVPASAYHADLIGDERPSLSSSIAKLLVEASPAHARAAHPRLNPNLQREDDSKFDIGTCVHALLLQGEQVFDRLAFDSWRTNDSKAAAAQTRAHGRIPLLMKDADRVDEMIGAVREHLAALDVDPPPFTDGVAEQTMVWEEDGVLCRARIDWLHTNGDVCDLKSTSRYAAGWDRGPLWDHGADVQAALYVRGLRKLTGREPKWTWIVAETSPPFGLIPYKLTAPVLALGNSKVDLALAKWRRCLESGEWPAYPPTVVEADLPAYIESRWLAREALEEAVAA